MFTLCENINTPIKHSKMEGLTTSLTFLGLHLNSVTMEASISDDRKCALLYELHWMKHQDKHTKRDMLSPVGKLPICCKVLPAGRIFLCRMIDLSNTMTNLHHCISLTTEMHLYIQWWLDLISDESHFEY